MTHTEVDRLYAEATVYPSRGPHSAPLTTTQNHLVNRIADLLASRRAELLADKPVKLSPVEQLAQAVLDGQLRITPNFNDNGFTIWTDR